MLHLRLRGIQGSLPWLPKPTCCEWRAQVYTKLRKESAISAGMPIAVRHLESMIRMSEAHAKMHLRSQVSDADIDTAVRCVLHNDTYVHAKLQLTPAGLHPHLAA
jgi:DNA replicative helicase MCM subunit Mcm2 (Cdc46/Mcm family)